MEMDAEVSTKKRGRPKGSKNKTKEAVMTAPEEREVAAAEGAPKEAPKIVSSSGSSGKKSVSADEEPPKAESKKTAVKKTAKKETSGKESASRETVRAEAEIGDVGSKEEALQPASETPAKQERDDGSAQSQRSGQKNGNAGNSKNNRRGSSKNGDSKNASQKDGNSAGGIFTSGEKAGDPKNESSKSKNKNNPKRKKPTTTYVQSLVGMVEVPAEGTVRPEYPQISPRGADHDVMSAAEDIREPETPKEAVQTHDDTAQEDAVKDINGIKVEGIFEMSDQSYGFLRKNGISSENDIYVSPMFTKKFNLKNGEFVRGVAKKELTDKYRPLLYVADVNGVPAYTARSKHKFDDMTPQFPRERFHLSRDRSDIAMRIIDLIAPVGKGQRGLIVAPPKSGKTILLQKIAKSIRANYPEVELMILLIDERPEEVTDMKDEVDAPVYYSTFDELPTNHIRIAELVLNRARGLVEMGRDVVILLDSITRLARAYNIALPASGRTLSGGLDTNALHKPKRFLGSARNMIEGGSLTIMATALIETGSKMDDVIFEEFKGTGNMELILDRKLSEKRVFPSIDIKRSGTRREELLLNREEYEAILKLRRALDQNGGNEPVELLSEELMKTRDNAELIQWINNVFTDKHLRK